MNNDANEVVAPGNDGDVDDQDPYPSVGSPDAPKKTLKSPTLLARVRAFVADPHVGDDIGLAPCYLVGLVLPSHRGGPAKLAVLLLDDGTVIGAYGRIVEQVVVEQFPSERPESDGDPDLWGYRSRWYGDVVGGFPYHQSPSATPTYWSLANLILRIGGDALPVIWWWYRRYRQDLKFSAIAQQLGNIDLQGQGAAAVLAEFGIVATVESMAFTARSFDSGGLDRLPEWLRRGLLTAPLPPNDPCLGLAERIRSEFGDDLWEMYLRYHTVEPLDRRAALAILRTAAEELLRRKFASTVVTFGKQRTFSHRIDALEDQWKAQFPLPIPPARLKPEERRAHVWRESVLAGFHTVREIGNKLHEGTEIPADEASQFHRAWVDLAEALVTPL